MEREPHEVVRYRDAAANCRSMAAVTTLPDIQTQWLDMAAQYDQLAKDAERLR
jgi:hypothetical protein